LRITFILASLHVSGGLRVIAMHAKGLLERGHDVRLFCLYSGSITIKKKIQYFMKKDVSILQPETNSLLESLGLECHVLKNRECLLDDDIPDADVVVATWWKTAEWVHKLAPEKGVKCYLVQGHEVFVFGKYHQVEATYRLPLHKFVVSRWLQDVMKVLYNDDDCMLVGNAVDCEYFNAPPRLKNAVMTVGFLYTPIVQKNIALAIQAIKKAKVHVPELRVLAFGHYDAGDDLPLPDWVEYYKDPSQSDIPKIYASCDAWLFPTLSEGFGLPVLEAMACRTPVLATRAGASPEFVNAQTGRLLLCSVDAFVDAIVEFAGMNDDTWLELSNGAYSRVRQESWNKSTTIFEDHLKSLLL